MKRIYPWTGLYSEEEIKAYLILGEWVRCRDCGDSLPYDEAALHPGFELCPDCDAEAASRAADRAEGGEG